MITPPTTGDEGEPGARQPGADAAGAAEQAAGSCGQGHQRIMMTNLRGLSDLHSLCSAQQCNAGPSPTQGLAVSDFQWFRVLGLGFRLNPKP